MPERNEEIEGDAAGSLRRQEGLRPRWTQDEAITFACARDYLAELQAAYAVALDELVSQPDADANRVDWLRGELVLLQQQQQRDLTVRDQAAIAEIRAAFKARLAAIRPNTESLAGCGDHHTPLLD